MTRRILDVRLVLDRDGRVRASVEGVRVAVTAETFAEALSELGLRMDRGPSAERSEARQTVEAMID